MQGEHVEGLADRFPLPRIELRLQTAFKAAQRMPRVRVFLANHFDRQLVVLNESHARRLSPPTRVPRRLHQLRQGDAPSCALIVPKRGLCNWPPIPSPEAKPLAWRRVKNDAKHREAQIAHSLLSQPEAWRANSYGSAVTRRLHQHPHIGILQTGVSIERQFSHISPAFPRSLASVLIPRPAARRVSASPLRAPCGFRLSENLCATNAKRFFESSEKASLGTWERGTSRRVAQECSEGNSGKYTQEK